MRLLRSLDYFNGQPANLCVTIGNFDGIHLGHQALFKKLKQLAESQQAKTMVILFEPQPMEYFAFDVAPARLQLWREKVEELQKLGIDYVLLLKFDDAFAALSPEEFIQRYLIDSYTIKGLVIGDDFRYGEHRRGDIRLLEKYSETHQFPLSIMTQLNDQDETRICSTYIRSVLAEGDFERAEQMLGRPYTLSGRVQHGAKRGREIGVPTANIDIKREHVALRGVYLAKVSFGDQAELPAVVNLGKRPTFDGKNLLLEVHLLDFDQDCYGKRLTVRFIEKIRDEQHFSDFSELKAQIHQDVADAKAYFAKK